MFLYLSLRQRGKQEWKDRGGGGKRNGETERERGEEGGIKRQPEREGVGRNEKTERETETETETELEIELFKDCSSRLFQPVEQLVLAELLIRKKMLSQFIQANKNDRERERERELSLIHI